MLWAAIKVIVIGGVAQTLQRGMVVDGGLTDASQTAPVAYPNPQGVFPRHGWCSAPLAATAVIGWVCALLAMVSVFLRRLGVRQNSTIEQLTILATVFMPLTFKPNLGSAPYGPSAVDNCR